MWQPICEWMRGPMRGRYFAGAKRRRLGSSSEQPTLALAPTETVCNHGFGMGKSKSAAPVTAAFEITVTAGRSE